MKIAWKNDESQCYTNRLKDEIVNIYGNAVSFAQPSAHGMEYVYTADLQTKEVLESFLSKLSIESILESLVQETDDIVIYNSDILVHNVIEAMKSPLLWLPTPTDLT